MFSATFRYAVISLLEIASSEDGINATELARRNSISVTYLANVLSDLRRMGLIRSRKGRRGGYQLTRSPDEINLLLLHQGLAGSPDIKPEQAENVAVLWLDVIEKRWQQDLERATLAQLQYFASIRRI